MTQHYEPSMKTHNVVGVMEISAPDLPLYVGVNLPTGCSLILS
ncbi:hypothetical protein CPT_Mansal_035 [Salmonella phage Mansal]|nr:hypothetical protein CPT_Mansal_039 [Salmonella phage Mansal]